MSDGVAAVMSRINQIRSAFGGQGGVLGVAGKDRFDEALRAASGRTATKSGSASRSGNDPLERLLPGAGRARAGGLRTESPQWPKGVPEEAEAYAEEFIAASEETGVPLRILLAVAWSESGFDPEAVSPAGALGMMQLMPGTAAGLGVDPSDPAQNILGGARYLAAQYEAFGSWDLAFAAYNAGPGAVQQYGGIPPYRETQNYLAAINRRLEGITAPTAPTMQATLFAATALLPDPAGTPAEEVAPLDLTTLPAVAPRTTEPAGEGAAGAAAQPAGVSAALGGLSGGLPGEGAMPGGTSGGTSGAGPVADPGPRTDVPAAAQAAAQRGAGPAVADATPTVLTTTPTAFGHQLLGLVQRGEADGRQSHRLTVRLDPPELGQVDVFFELRGDQVHVIVRPERAEGGTLLLQQRERIAELFAREGLELSGFDLGAGNGGSDRDGNGPSGSRRYRDLDLDLTHDVAFTVDRELRL